MTVILDIPKEFEEHITYDKFQDSLMRIETDIKVDIKEHRGISGNYEFELIKMLEVAFNNAKIVQPLDSLIITKTDGED